MKLVLRQQLFPVHDYDLAATLSCGQAFRWQQFGDSWEGVIAGRWVRLCAQPEGIGAAAPFREEGGPERAAMQEWDWLAEYLQTGVDLDRVLETFPDDEPMRAAVARCRGLRLLQQEPWECLASFILSSTKQIVQIRQIIEELCQRLGEPVAVPEGHPPRFAFPGAARVAACGEALLRGCKMGFRAPYLLGAARMVAGGAVRLDRLRDLSLERARSELIAIPGVGRKIADCVLLFSCGFAGAFPVDVWIMKALRNLYFPKRRPAPRRLRTFADTHFGPNAGLAQQYLFHYMRLTAGRARPPAVPSPAISAQHDETSLLSTASDQH
jgi:N-glycosylase/DNA lyase